MIGCDVMDELRCDCGSPACDGSVLRARCCNSDAMLVTYTNGVLKCECHRCGKFVVEIGVVATSAPEKT